MAKAEWENNDYNPVSATLYRTPGGAYFEVAEVEITDGDGETDCKHYFEPMTAAQAQRWVTEKDDVELIEELLVTVPEATAADEEASATIYVWGASRLAETSGCGN